MNFKWIMIAILAILLLIVTVSISLAQEEPPSFYDGLQNPFSWTDAQAQAAGKNVYQQSCAGCHGSNGAGVAGFDFSSPSFSQGLQNKPGPYYGILSEGRLSKGMPPYESLLSEEQRWRTLTYIWSLSAAPSLPQPTPGPSTEGASLTLTVPPQLNTGEVLSLVAELNDIQGKPISSATVKFLLSENFFASGSMEIGDAVTNDVGVATLQYIPRRPGETEVIARYNTTEASHSLNITDSGEVFYHTVAGLHLPSLGPEIFIGPKSAHEIVDGKAPMTALRLPGGTLSWLWLFVAVLMLVWGTYIFVMYQVLRISTVKGISTGNSRVVPLVWIAVLIGLGILMVLMVITGPFSHFNLLP